MKVFDLSFMEEALLEAQQAENQGEVPVGAVVVYEGEIIARAHNQPISTHNPCAHAEILALQRAGQHLHNYRLNDCTLYVTLEPCPMCVSAMIHARISRCVYAAPDPKTGALGGAIDFPALHRWNHVFESEGGVLSDKASQLLITFFKNKRT